MATYCLNFIATLSACAGSANIFVYNYNVHILDSFKLVEEFHGQFKIGGGKKKEVLLDWRGNEKEEEEDGCIVQANNLIKPNYG
jgi:hypothetical protein